MMLLMIDSDECVIDVKSYDSLKIADVMNQVCLHITGNKDLIVDI